MVSEPFEKSPSKRALRKEPYNRALHNGERDLRNGKRALRKEPTKEPYDVAKEA